MVFENSLAGLFQASVSALTSNINKLESSTSADSTEEVCNSEGQSSEDCNEEACNSEIKAQSDNECLNFWDSLSTEDFFECINKEIGKEIEAKNEHISALKTLLADNESDLKKQKDSVAEIKKQWEASVAEIKKQWEDSVAEVERTKEDSVAEIKKIKEDSSAEIETLKQTSSDALKKVEDSAVKIEELKREAEENKEALSKSQLFVTEKENTIKQLTDDLTKLTTSIKTTCKITDKKGAAELQAEEILTRYAAKFSEMESFLKKAKTISTAGLGKISENNMHDVLSEIHKTEKGDIGFKNYLEKKCDVFVVDKLKKEELEKTIKNNKVTIKKLELDVTEKLNFISHIESFEMFGKPLGKIALQHLNENKSKFNYDTLTKTLKESYGIYGFIDSTQHNFYTDLSSTLKTIKDKETSLEKVLREDKNDYKNLLGKKDSEIKEIEYKIQREGDFDFSLETLQQEYHERYITLNLSSLDCLSLNCCKAILKNCLFLLQIPFDNIQNLSFRMQKIDAIVTVERVSFLRFIKLLQKLIADTTEMDYEKQINYLVEGKRNKYRLDEFLTFIHNSLENMIQENESVFSNNDEVSYEKNSSFYQQRDNCQQFSTYNATDYYRQHSLAEQDRDLLNQGHTMLYRVGSNAEYNELRHMK